MICTTIERINGVDIKTENAFMHTTPKENQIYCSVCENEVTSQKISPLYNSYEARIINPKTQTERVTVSLCVCTRCANDFATYGCD